MSHELRSPLTAIIGYGELLGAHWDQIADPDRRDHVRRMTFAANRQLRLVEDLLLLSRIEHGVLAAVNVDTDVPALIDRAAEEVQANYPSQMIHAAGPAGLAVCADAARVVQIVVNLVDNAVKYSPPGMPVAITWELAGEASAPDGGDHAGPSVVIRVRDHGPGISLRGRERLFERFGRLGESPIRGGRVGTGLGLYVSRQLARATHGDLALETTDATGSVFRLSLPAPRQ